MRFLHSILVSLFLGLSMLFLLGTQEVFAVNYITQIGKESSKEDIKKLQQLFRDLELYHEAIDGNFSSIKDELITFQIENGVIPSRDHAHAGYYGKKTARALANLYGSTFERLRDTYLQEEQPEVGKETVFEATAYYSPIRGQKKYYKGTYEAEIRLQGNGKHTASGTQPHTGTIAAPRNYDFGTKIYIDGYGVGVVEDRGGAIVGNKIDIWMGVGDEGRERAEKFGRRKIKGYVVDADSEVTIEFPSSDLYQYADLKVNKENPNPENVKRLQELLKKVGLYTGKITGNYHDIEETLIAFQEKNGITLHKGYFGAKTYAKIVENYNNPDKRPLERKEKKKIIPFPLLSENDKKLAEVAKNRVIEIYSDQTKSEEELDEKINTLKARLRKFVVAQREEKKKELILYLIDIL